MPVTDAAGLIPSQIGPYRILERIGEGGMGAVYLAEQDHPHRLVALKVIRADAYSTQLLRRFEHEAEMLGRLQHSGIAQIYQAGAHSTPHGVQPYFAMEYVRGKALDDFARERELGTHARLELAAKICDAIEHAHQKGVIHRDLKPGNILVTDEGQPKILDFGVARITDADVRTTTLHTDVGALVGTLAYMSPEQASGDPDQLDTRSDVYSLGVVFFELLTGQLPYRIDRRMVPEAVRVIREEEPSRLSTHDRTLRGDVETIVAKALEKDKARRYPSASALAADIRRYLADEPISARPPSAGYQLSKFARRNKVLVGGIAAFVLALVAGSIVATAQAVRAREAEKTVSEQLGLISDALARATESQKEALEQAGRASAAEQLALERLKRAESEQKKAEQSAAFLTSLFGGIDPYEARGADTTLLRRILEGAVGRISSELEGQPEAEISIRHALGYAYSALEAFDEAASQLRAAEALALEHFGADGRVTLRTQRSLANLHFVRGEPATAEELDRRTLERQERLFGPRDLDALATRIALGETLVRVGKLLEAESVLQRAREEAEQVVPEDGYTLQRAKFVLAALARDRGRFDEAEPLYAEVVEWRRARFGEEHSSTLEALANLALVVQNQNRLGEAEALHRRVLEGIGHVHGADSLPALAVLHNVASVCAMDERFEEAEATWTECIEAGSRSVGPRHPTVLHTLSVLGQFLTERGRLADAEPLLQEALEGQRDVLGEDHEHTMSTKFAVASLLQEQGRVAESAELLAEIADHHRRMRGEADPDVGLALYNLAGTLQDAGDDEGAEAVLRDVLALREEHHWEDEPYLAAVINALARVHEGRGERAEAERLYEEALDMRRRRFGAREVAYSLNDYGNALLLWGDVQRAEPLLRELSELQPQLRRTDEWQHYAGLYLLGRCLSVQGRFAEAAPLLERACTGLLDHATVKPPFVNTAVQWLVRTYDEWELAEPGAGHGETAANWRARLAPAGQ